MYVKYDGGEADQHVIEAYYGAESLTGIARAAVLVAHFADTGEVRHRAPYSSHLQFFLEAPQQGSLEFPLRLAAKVAGQIGKHKEKLAIALLALVLTRATGQASEQNLSVGDQFVGSGDVDALAEAATPGLLRAHSWIDDIGKTISFHDEQHPAINFNSATKTYLESEDFGDRNATDVSVAALNANSKIGRVYFHGLGRTVPFKVAKEATNRTVSNLSSYLTQYVKKTGATVNIDYQPVYYADGRLKRILIFDCFPIDGLE
jgi:hypothetical protein